MAEVTPQKRALPPRERRESAAKRRASSPAQPPLSTSTPATRKPSTAASTPATARKTGYTRGPYKKRATLVHVQTPTSASRSSPSVSVSEDVLPTRIIANKPLPTTKQKQPAKLSLNDYQSIVESAILAASLHQSRMQWLYHGIFDKYWVKPVKRKGITTEPPNNPDVKSMQRLGAATMTIEPHTFDVIFYTVKDPAAPLPYQRHPNQHTVKHMAPPPHPVAYAGYPPHTPHQQSRPTPSHPSAPSAPASIPPSATSPSTPAQSVPTPAPPPAQNGHRPSSMKQEDNTQSASPATASSPAPPAAPTSHDHQTQTLQPIQRPNPTPPARGSTQDPVIQMLAARAASDPQLKDLMKIVATSRASPEQLKEFQSHIDEFNEVIRRQEAERVAKAEDGPPRQPRLNQAVAETPQSPAAPTEPKPATPNPATPAPPPAQAQATVPARPSMQSVPQTQPRQQPASAPNPTAPTTGSGALPGVVHTFPNPPPPAGRGGPTAGYVGHPPAPSARPEPFIKNIVMEITSVLSGSQSACADRWLFPEYAVLEMRPGGLEMICSFLVERKGSQIMSGAGVEPPGENGETEGKWSADQEYYQPVTMTIKALNHKTIETIAKAAKTLPAVQEYLKEVMSKKQRAPVEYLVQQLPRERSRVGADSTETGFVDSGVELGSDSASEEDELKDVYGI